MTNLIRIIHDREEACNAKLAAETEFLDEVDQHDRGHLVTDEAIERWFGMRPKMSLGARIQREFGEAESVWLER